MPEGLLLSLWLAAVSTAVPADLPPAFRLLALSPASGTAVVAAGTEAEPGSPTLVRKGEEIGETGLTLVEVLPDRIEVRQELPAADGAPPEERRLWIDRAHGAEPSRVQILDRAAPPAQALGAPLTALPALPEGPADPSPASDPGSPEPSTPERQPGSPSDVESGMPASPPGEAR